MSVSNDFQVRGKNASALFNLTVHRGEGMVLLGMDWKNGRPSDNFVGFAIEYMEPGGVQFYVIKNRLSFPGPNGSINPNQLSTRLSPIQMFRWVHFPRHANIPGLFTYRVSPVFMNSSGELSYGEFQQVQISLFQETYPGLLNVAFTRGFVASQAFVDRYEKFGPISTLLPAYAKDGLNFKSTHVKAEEALSWMGFEATKVIFELLDKAILDNAKVYIVAYDLNIPGLVAKMVKLGKNLKVIIDDDGTHGESGSAENAAELMLVASAGRDQVKRQHMGKLQHNKTMVIDGPGIKAVVCGSTNYSWRGFYVQANNAIVAYGVEPVRIFLQAFNNYWMHDAPSDFGSSESALWHDLGIDGVDAKVSFSPHVSENALLEKIGQDIENNTSSCLLYSLAFLSLTEGPVRNAVTKVTLDTRKFVYGISDKKTGGFDLLKPDGNVAPVSAAALSANLPEPFRKEPTGGGGTRMHHKFVVIDFDKPTARVYMGSYNFSRPADISNGENLLLIKDRKIAVAYMIEALRIFDHYRFRLAQKEAKTKKLNLRLPPKGPGELPWFEEDYTVVRKIKDRILFSK